MLFQQAKKHAQSAQDRAKAAQDQVKAAKKVALEAEMTTSSCGHVPRHRRNSPSCCTSRCVTSQRYLVVLLLSVSGHSGALLYAKVQLLV
jgi:hypothetical protein